MKKISLLFIAGISLILGGMALNSQPASASLDGEWKLEKVICQDKEQEGQLNKRINDGTFDFVIKFESNRFRETIDEKKENRRIMAITVGSYSKEETKKQIVLKKSSTSLTEGSHTTLTEWSSEDLTSKKLLGLDLSAKALVLEAQDACDDNKGSLRFKKI